jgi:hypothetical protein
VAYSLQVAKIKTSKGNVGGLYGTQPACIENLNSDFMRARGLDLDVLELERLACTPAYGGLALDDLSGGFGHAAGYHSNSFIDGVVAAGCETLGAGLTRISLIGIIT